jgi:transcriptional regulator with XRE-family HTH domain
MFVTHPLYIREKARHMRVERDLTIDEISERLGISRQTIFHWLRDLPLQRRRRSSAGQRLGNEAMQNKYKALRDAAYEMGRREFDELAQEPGFRDFVCMYIAEGYKRNRNVVQLCNSDLNVVVLANRWIRRFSSNTITYSLQYHADQDLDEIRGVWADLLDIDPAEIRLQRKSNSNQLAGRTWRCRYGVLAVITNDTLFRARLQGWIERITAEWLDLPVVGV